MGRQVVAVDLDGVCYEWDKTARYMLRRYRGQDHLTEPSTGWNGIQESVPQKDWSWLWSIGVKKGLFRYGHMVKDCRVALEDLVRTHKLVIVTHRPSIAVNDTLAWADLYFQDIPLHGFHILSDNAAKSTVAFDILVDDRPENVEDALGHGRKALLFNRPWNQAALQPRAYGWLDVVRRIRDGV